MLSDNFLNNPFVNVASDFGIFKFNSRLTPIFLKRLFVRFSAFFLLLPYMLFTFPIKLSFSLRHKFYIRKKSIFKRIQLITSTYCCNTIVCITIPKTIPFSSFSILCNVTQFFFGLCFITFFFGLCFITP